MSGSIDDDEDPEHSQGPAPAPLDLGRLEVEARQAAAKHVASLLQVSYLFESSPAFNEESTHRKQ